MQTIAHSVAGVAPENFCPPVTQPRFALACDAISNRESHGVASLDAYLEVAIEQCEDFLVGNDRDGIFDDKVLAAIERSSTTVDNFSTLLSLIAALETPDLYMPSVQRFFADVLAYKKRRPARLQDSYLRRDSMHFIARELFVTALAALLAQRHWAAARALFDYRYPIDGHECSYPFTAFDGFLRSLEVFRNRRLKLGRVSVCADLLKYRVEARACSFDDFMQADFVAHLVALLRCEPHSTPWVPRTLSHAQELQKSGFALFVVARGARKAECLEALFDVENWAQVIAQVRTVIEASGGADNLQANGIDYAGLLAARNSLFDQ